MSHNLFGVTYSGGAGNKGLVYTLVFKNGSWSQTVIHDFCADGNCTTGAAPAAPILEDSSGNLFSTTANGGNVAGCSGTGCGIVFELKK